jgi:hypothetical protein
VSLLIYLFKLLEKLPNVHMFNGNFILFVTHVNVVICCNFPALLIDLFLPLKKSLVYVVLAVHLRDETHVSSLSQKCLFFLKVDNGLAILFVRIVKSIEAETLVVVEDRLIIFGSKIELLR